MIGAALCPDVVPWIKTVEHFEGLVGLGPNEICKVRLLGFGPQFAHFSLGHALLHANAKQDLHVEGSSRIVTLLFLLPFVFDSIIELEAVDLEFRRSPHNPRMGPLEGDVVALSGQFPHQVDVIILGRGASLASGRVLARVVGPQIGDSTGLEGQAGVSIESSNRVGGVLIATNGPPEGVDDHEFSQRGIAKVKQGAGACGFIQGRQARQQGIVKAAEVILGAVAQLHEPLLQV